MANATDIEQAWWCRDSDEPEIVQQSRPVFSDYAERVRRFWDGEIKWSTGNTESYRSRRVYDCDIRTAEECKDFDYDRPPVWFDRVLCAKVPEIKSMRFVNTYERDWDVAVSVLMQNGRTYRGLINHDNVSDRLVLQVFELKIYMMLP